MTEPVFGPKVQELAEQCEVPLHRYRFHHMGKNSEEITERTVRAIYEELPKGRPFGRKAAMQAFERAQAKEPPQDDFYRWLSFANYWYGFQHLVRIGVVERVARNTFTCGELPEDPLAVPSGITALRAVREYIAKAPVNDQGQALVSKHRLLCLLDAAMI